LNFENTSIKNEGAIALEKVFASLVKLKAFDLNIRNCKITDNGFKSLSNGFSKLTNLE
jgi:hypothetical protein